MCRILHRWVNEGGGQEVSGGRGDSESATPATDEASLPTQSPVYYTYTSARLGSAGALTHTQDRTAPTKLGEGRKPSLTD